METTFMTTYNLTDFTLGFLLANWRAKHNLTREEVAKRLSMNVEDIVKYEYGYIKFDEGVAVFMCYVGYHATLADIIHVSYCQEDYYITLCKSNYLEKEILAKLLRISLLQVVESILHVDLRYVTTQKVHRF